MEELEITRRRFTLGTTAALSASLAGCLGGDDEEENGNGDDGNGDDTTETEEETGNGENEEEEDEEQAEETEEEEEPQRGALVVNLENEDGEPVSEGLTFKAVPNGDEGNTLLMQSFADGQGAMQNVAPGSYTATVEGDGFETAEDELTIEAGEETELTLVLEEAAEDDGDE